MARGRGRKYNGNLQHHQPEIPIGDSLGFPYPPLPPGGSHQVLGTMSTDPNITPPIPEWLPKRLHIRWSTIWHGREKQYKTPGSTELIPWDTIHNPMGDYQGQDQYYVKGCFGYNSNGEEFRYRPGLPGVHVWRGRGLAIAPPPERQPRPPPPLPTMFKFYESCIPYTKDELADLQFVKSSGMNKKSEVFGPSSCKDASFSAEDCFPLNGFTGVFDDGPSEKCSDENLALSDAFDSSPTPTYSTESASSKTSNNALFSFEEGKLSLVNMPGEIRNLIYGYLFNENNDYEIVWCTRQKDLTHWKHNVLLENKGHKTGWRRLHKVDPKLDYYFHRPIKDTKSATARRCQARRIYGRHNKEDRVVELQSAGPAAFLLTCKRIYEEAMPLFYQRHNFSFSSRSLLHKFMGSLSPIAMANIGKLYIAHDPQGWPLKVKDGVLVEKEYRYWIEDLKKVVANFTGLRELVMLLQIRDSHVNNATRADWAMGLQRGLAGLKYLDQFQHFELVVCFACDTSNVAWAQSRGNALQRDRAQDLEDLVCVVKSKIFEPVNVPFNKM